MSLGSENFDNTNSELEPVRDALESSLSEKVINELDPLFQNIKSVEQNGNKITIDRQSTSDLPLDGELLNRNIQASAVQVNDKLSFNYDPNTRSISQIDGLSLKMNAFGTPFSLPLKSAKLELDQAGNKVLATSINNPLPESAQRIIGLPSTIQVDVPIENGGLSQVKLSNTFSELAKSTNSSIGGLLATDALNEASKVALFAESNPKWINQVVEPAVQGIYKAMDSPEQENKSEGQPPQDQQPAPEDTRPDAGAQPPTQTEGEKKQSAPGEVQRASDNEIARPGDHTFTMNVNGAERTYRAHVPTGYDGSKPVPLVLMLHGQGQTGEDIARITKFNETADREGFIAIYPESRKWFDRDDWRTWETDNGLTPPGSHADDISFLRSIIDKTEQDYNIDDKRIHMAGLSNGGMMTYRAAGDLSDKLASIAVISGAMSGKEPTPKSPLSVYNIHGTADEVIPYEGLKNVPASLSALGLPIFKPTEYATEFWKEQNRATREKVKMDDDKVTDRSFVNPVSGAEVKETTIHGGVHVPDNIDQIAGDVWNFFKDHEKISGRVAGTTQQSDNESFNLQDRLKSHIQTRGLKGIELDAGQALAEVPKIPDGSLSPAGMIKQFEEKTNVDLNDKVSSFVKQTDKVAKVGSRVSADLKEPQEIALLSGGDGAVKQATLKLNDPATDVINENGRPALKNIEGVSFDVKAMGQDVSLNTRELIQKVDESGAPYYQLKIDNPLPDAARKFLFAKAQIPIDLQIGQSGNATVLNEDGIKDAVLGVNPISRGAIDLGEHAGTFVSNPSWQTAIRPAADLGIATATTGGTLMMIRNMGKLGRIGGGAAALTIASPALIHALDRMID